MMNIIFICMFILGVKYLIQHRLNLKKAADLAKHAVYPKTDEEFRSILLLTEWKEMVPLTKDTKSYQYVKWGTVVALILLTVLLFLIVTTEWLGSSFFTFVYLFFVIIRAIKHHGNFFILPNGVILHSKYYSFNQIKSYETEQIIRWHELYGLNDRVNNAYKLTFKMKKTLFQPNYIVVADHNHLKKLLRLLDEQGVPFVQKEEKERSF